MDNPPERPVISERRVAPSGGLCRQPLFFRELHEFRETIKN
jgi:hypothetical protein